MIRAVEKPILRVFWSNDHAGHYPVAVASVVVAEDETAARALMDAELLSRGLTPDDYTLIELPLHVPKARVLQDGNY